MVAGTFYHAVRQWCELESMELEQLQPPTRKMLGRSYLSTAVDDGVAEGATTVRVRYPYTPLPLDLTNLWSSPSYVDESDAVHRVAADLLCMAPWDTVFPDPETRGDCLHDVSNSSILQETMRKNLSSFHTIRKRDARNMLVELLGYRKLHSSALSTVLSDEEKKHFFTEATAELTELQSKLFPDGFDGGVRLDRWRTQPVQLLMRSSSTTPMDGRTNNSSSQEQVDVLLRTDVARAVFEKFLGYTPARDPDSATAMSMLSLPRLDTWFAASMKLMQFPSKKGRGGQNPYQDFTKPMVPASCSAIHGHSLCSHPAIPPGDTRQRPHGRHFSFRDGRSNGDCTVHVESKRPARASTVVPDKGVTRNGVGTRLLRYGR